MYGCFTPTPSICLLVWEGKIPINSGGLNDMKRTFTLGIMLVLFLACVGTVSATVNLVSNPGFETPITASGNFDTYTAPSASLTGWSLDSGGIDHIKGYWQPAHGFQSIDLSSTVRGTISQDIPTEMNGVYQLSFAMSGNPECPPDIKTLEVKWGAQTLGPYTFDKTVISDQHVDMKWVTFTEPGLTASSATTKIIFKDISSGTDTRCGVVLDDIEVIPVQSTPIPEFPTIAIPVVLIVGILGAVLFIQRTKEN